MYTAQNVPGPEYRVRTVVRHIVTRYCHPYESEDVQGRSVGSSGSSTVIGEFPNEQQAYDVAQALAKADAHAEATVSV